MAEELEKKEEKEKQDEELKPEEEKETPEKEEEEFELNEDGTQKLDEDGNPVKKKALEPWQESDKEGVPVATHVRMKQKLKGRITEKDDKIASLETEIENLKKGKSTPPELPKRPKADDFESDEEYQAALDEYDEKVTSARYERIEQKNELKRRQRRAREKLEKDLDSHYERAERLVNESGIDPDVYKKTDEIFRETIETVRPKEGNLIADQLISILGEGSEKVVYYAGRNEAVRDKIKSLLIEDPSGMKLAVYLGHEKARLNGPKPRTSQAAKPSVNPKGDAHPTNEAGLKRKYDEAHAKGNIQAAYNIKKEARQAGVNVSNW